MNSSEFTAWFHEHCEKYPASLVSHKTIAKCAWDAAINRCEISQAETGFNSRRDFFAAAAMQGILSSDIWMRSIDAEATHRDQMLPIVATSSVMAADELIKALGGEKG